MTHSTLLVLRALTAQPDREMYGMEIMRAISLPSGTVYPLLDRAEAAGWVTARAEDIDPRKAERPRRRYYRITPGGYTAAREALERETAHLSALGIATAPAADPAGITAACKHPRVHVKGVCPDCHEWAVRS